MDDTLPEGARGLSLRIATTESEVEALLGRVHDFADEAGLPPALAYHLALGCEELAANVLSHGAGARFIAMTLQPLGDGWQLMVEDDGPAFDPLDQPEADTSSDLADRAIGGLGLHLIRSFALTLRYERSGGCNRLTALFGTAARSIDDGDVMKIEETALPGVYLAALDGRLDTGSAAAVEEGLLPLLGQFRVVLDLAGVGFVSSAGLRVLLKAAKLARASGNAFVICGLQPTVREVYEISGFDRIIQAHPSRDEALAAFS